MTSAPPSVLARTGVNGSVRLHYLEFVPEHSAGLPVVLIPGLSDLAEDYAEVLPLFGRRVVVFDLRGRGRSDSPAHGYALADHVGDIEALVAAAGIDRFHLATFSRGTAYGLGFLVGQPDRVETVSIGDYPAREIGLPNGFPPDFGEGRWRGGRVYDRISPVALDGIVSEAVERGFWDDLARLGKPLLVIRGGRASRAGFVDEQAQDLYRAAVPTVRIVTLSDSAHDLFRPDPTLYPLLVARFVEEHEPTS